MIEKIQATIYFMVNAFLMTEPKENAAENLFPSR